MLVITASYRDYELIIRREVHTTHTELVAAERGCHHQRAHTPHLQVIMITCHVSHVAYLDTWSVPHLPSHQMGSIAGQRETCDGLPDGKNLSTSIQRFNLQTCRH